MSTKGVRLLSSGVKLCTSLQSLTLDGVNALKTITGFDEEALTYLVEALHDHPGVVELSLRRNDIGKQFWVASIDALLEGPKSKLEVLNLEDNAISSMQADILADSNATGHF